MLLNIVQCTGQLPTNKNYLPQMSSVRLRDPDLDRRHYEHSTLKNHVCMIPPLYISIRAKQNSKLPTPNSKAAKTFEHKETNPV